MTVGKRLLVSVFPLVVSLGVVFVCASQNGSHPNGQEDAGQGEGASGRPPVQPSDGSRGHRHGGARRQTGERLPRPEDLSLPPAAVDPVVEEQRRRAILQRRQEEQLLEALLAEQQVIMRGIRVPPEAHQPPSPPGGSGTRARQPVTVGRETRDGGLGTGSRGRPHLTRVERRGPSADRQEAESQDSSRRVQAAKASLAKQLEQVREERRRRYEEQDQPPDSERATGDGRGEETGIERAAGRGHVMAGDARTTETRIRRKLALGGVAALAAVVAAVVLYNIYHKVVGKRKDTKKAAKTFGKGHREERGGLNRPSSGTGKNNNDQLAPPPVPLFHQAPSSLRPRHGTPPVGMKEFKPTMPVVTPRDYGHDGNATGMRE